MLLRSAYPLLHESGEVQTLAHHLLLSWLHSQSNSNFIKQKFKDTLFLFYKLVPFTPIYEVGSLKTTGAQTQNGTDVSQCRARAPASSPIGHTEGNSLANPTWVSVIGKAQRWSHRATQSGINTELGRPGKDGQFQSREGLGAQSLLTKQRKRYFY